MSAYIVDRAVILGLTKAAVEMGVIEAAFAQPTATMLWEENVASASYRYGGESVETLPGPIGETYHIEADEATSAETPNPKQVTEWVAEHVYQSCEHDAWELSRARRIVASINEAAGKRLDAWRKGQAQARVDAAEAARTQREQDAQKGREMLAGRKETYCIVAELHEDESDSQSDYFSSRNTKTVVLALSAHGKDLFSEMRKAAATFPETAHLGPGCDEWRVMKLAPKNDPYNHHWDGRLGEYNDEQSVFPTRAEAQAFLDAALARDKAKNEAVPFEAFCPEVPNGAEIECDKIEHREKYSMGKGYYLQAGSTYSGWRVRKTSLHTDTLAAVGRGDHLLKLPTASPTPIAPEPIQQPATEPTCWLDSRSASYIIG